MSISATKNNVAYRLDEFIKDGERWQTVSAINLTDDRDALSMYAYYREGSSGDYRVSISVNMINQANRFVFDYDMHNYTPDFGVRYIANIIARHARKEFDPELFEFAQGLNEFHKYLASKVDTSYNAR